MKSQIDQIDQTFSNDSRYSVQWPDWCKIDFLIQKLSKLQSQLESLQFVLDQKREDFREFALNGRKLIQFQNEQTILQTEQNQKLIELNIRIEDKQLIDQIGQIEKMNEEIVDQLQSISIKTEEAKQTVSHAERLSNAMESIKKQRQLVQKIKHDNEEGKRT
ncbi:Hypothetical_protein [Hexamita inflata]|uniref:Hypothetical_protein n=1 Tax=Hexamita inflata TaxID=28002 RepID=A0AA86P185_9EUKA|nr:Hypothetical protein HINF_LOCUS17353 [Hexamita inflata]